jgi:hypothetical protein
LTVIRYPLTTPKPPRRPARRGCQAARRLAEVQAETLMTAMRESKLPFCVSTVIARRLGMTLTQLQKAAVALEEVGAVRLVATWGGLLICKL